MTRGLTVATLLLFALPPAVRGHEPLRRRPHRPAEEVLSGPRARLGVTGDELRRAFGEALGPGRRSRSSERGTTSPRIRVLSREMSPPEDGGPLVAAAEYELFDGRVFRIRWRLGKRFEAPILEPLAHVLRHRLGDPVVDQRIDGKLRTGSSTLRRIGWALGGSALAGRALGGRPEAEQVSLELRQLSPQTGGPVFLTLTDRDAVRAITAAGLTPPAQPDRGAPWWQSRSEVPEVPSEDRRRELVWDFEDVVVALGLP